MGAPQNIIPCLKLTHFRALVDPPHTCYKLELVLGVQHLKGHHTMGTHVSIIPRGYNPYLRPENPAIFHAFCYIVVFQPSMFNISFMEGHLF